MELSQSRKISVKLGIAIAIGSAMSSCDGLMLVISTRDQFTTPLAEKNMPKFKSPVTAESFVGRDKLCKQLSRPVEPRRRTTRSMVEESGVKYEWFSYVAPF